MSIYRSIVAVVVADIVAVVAAAPACICQAAAAIERVSTFLLLLCEAVTLPLCWAHSHTRTYVRMCVFDWGVKFGLNYIVDKG